MYFQGVPFPEQEQCAIDSVVQYSIERLGFTPDNIVLYAWSIGGYTASWAAMNYPDVKYVVCKCFYGYINSIFFRYVDYNEFKVSNLREE